MVAMPYLPDVDILGERLLGRVKAELEEDRRKRQEAEAQAALQRALEEEARRRTEEWISGRPWWQKAIDVVLPGAQFRTPPEAPAAEEERGPLERLGRTLEIGAGALTRGLTLGLGGPGGLIERTVFRLTGAEPPPSPEPETTVEKAAATVGELAGSLVPVSGLYETVGRAAARLIPEAATGLAARAGRAFLPGAASGAVYEGVKSAAEGRSLPEIGKEAAVGAALFGGGDVAARAIGKAATRLLERARPAIPRLELPEAAEVPAVQAMTIRPDLGMEVAGEGEAPARRAIVERLEKILDIPLRVGRYQEKAAGIYKGREEVIRTKLAEDLPVLAHEAGHHLDRLLNLSAPNQAFDAELVKLGRAAGEGLSPARVRKEGVAEFVRLYLGDREAALREAPEFYRHFEARLAESPRLESALKKAQNDIHAYLRADPVSRVKAAISFGFDRPERERPSVGEKIKSLWQVFYTRVFDELKPLHDAVQAITGGRRIPAPEDPYKQAVLLRDSGRLAHTFIWKGQIDENYNIVGPSLREIIAPLDTREKYRDFGAYVVAKRVKELYRQKARGRDIAAFPFSEADADAAIERLGNPEFDRIHEQLKGWFASLVDMLERSGLIDIMTKARILSSAEEYVPLYRVFAEEGRFGRRRLADLPRPVKALRGSGRTVIDPIESAVRQAYVFTNLALRNNVARLLAELAEKFPGAGRFIEKIPGDVRAINLKLGELKKVLEEAGADLSGTDLDEVVTVFRAGQVPRAKPDEHIITVWREGKPEFYQVSRELYDILTGANAGQLHWFFNLLRYPASLLRAGATLTIDFALRNPLRDLGSAFVYEGVMPWDIFRAIAHMAGKSDLYTKWKAAGGDQATFWSIDRDYLKQDVRRLIERGWREQLKHGVLHPIDALYKLRELSENVTRMATFGRKLGWSEAPTREALEEAALAARDVTIDFRRYGTWGRDWNAASAFANPALQGWDKFLRQLKKDPLGVSLRAFALVTLPSIALYFLNRGNPYYEELPEWRKDLFWNIPIDGGRRFLMWPKPFEIGIIFGTIPERFLRWLADHDPRAFKHLGDTVLSTLPGILPTVFEGPLELWANRSFFTGLPIVPMREQKLEPALQYGPYTSETAKLLGERLGWSPRKIEQYLQSVMATWGRYALGISDAILEAAGLAQAAPRPVRGPEEKPVLRSFVTRPKAGQSPTVERFYDLYNRAQQVEASVRERRRRGLPVALSEEEKYLISKLPVMRKIAKDLSEYREWERRILEDRGMTPEEKRAKLNRLELMEINRVRDAFGKELLQ